MPPPLLFDLGGVDLNATKLDRTQIYEILPHRHEFMLLDGVCHVDLPSKQLIAYHHVREESWWWKGHVPGRPLLPGVLLLEMAAQCSAVLAKLTGDYDGFIGFGGVDECRFREPVTYPGRLYLLSLGREHRPRRIMSDAQGVIDGRVVFEARITGMTMR